MNYPQSQLFDFLPKISKRYNGLDSTPEPPIPATHPLPESRTLVFIDSGVSEQQTLLDALAPDTEVIRLDGDRDGIEQIIEAIAGRTGIDSIHLVSHGSSGRVQLGTTQLDAETLDAYLPQWQILRGSLSEGADILLYGCNVGTSDTGITFLQKLADLTGADIAASNDLTGSAELNGNWTLEVSTGNIDAPVPFQSEAIAAYNAVLAKTYTVPAGDVTELIKAITDAKNQDSIINLAGGTYTLTTSDNFILGANGLPSIQTGTLTINGNGAEIVRAENAPGFRIFHIGANANVTLNNLTVKNGLANIPNSEENNRRDGGGIYNEGTLTLNQSTITGNRAEDDGGGIKNERFLTVRDSTISNNSAGSELNDNPDANGGGIQNGSTAVISNSTISHNQAGKDGGGIYNTGNLTVNHSTIAFNVADSDGINTGNGGGIWGQGRNISLNLGHTLIAGNEDQSPSGDVHRDVSGSVNPAEYNLIGDVTGSSGLNGGTNYSFNSLGVSDINAVINPTLALNGADPGSPLTHALIVGSPAINLGNPNVNPQLATDQRGTGFERKVGTAIDIGAYEQQLLPVITEIMYHPRSAEPDWEWVEIYNPTDQTLNLKGFVFANANADPTLPPANIAEGTIAPGKTGILFNANLLAESFKIAWDTGDIPLIPVSNWSALGNTSDRIGLWPSLSSYRQGFTTAIDEVAYNTTGLTPSVGASLYLNPLTYNQEDLTKVNDIGNNWLISAIGAPTAPTPVVAKAYESTLDRNNSGLDIGSPGPTDKILPRFENVIAQNVTTAGEEPYSFTVTFTDNRALDWSTLEPRDIIVTGPKNESLTVTARTTPNHNGNFNSINVIYKITPPGDTWDSGDNGTYTVTLQQNQVTDTTGNAIASQELGRFAVNINTPPTLAPITQTGTKNTSFVFKPEYFTSQFTDSDGNTLQKISITSLPTNGTLFFDGNLIANPLEIPLGDIGKLSFVPNNNFNGPVSFTWNGFDGTDYAKTPSTVNLTINAPPTLANPLENQTTTPGTNFTFPIPENTFDDADIAVYNDRLTYTATLSNADPLPKWLTFNEDGTFTGTPGGTDLGTLPIKVTATDKFGASISDTFDLIIQPPNGGGSNTGNGSNPDTGTGNGSNNVPPTLANPLENQTTTPGTNFTFPIPENTFNDADIAVYNDRLTYTATLSNGDPLPKWLTFNEDGTFTGTPGGTDLGTLPIKVTATDKFGASISDTFDLIIQPPNGGGNTGDGGTGDGGTGGGTNPDTGTDRGSNPGTEGGNDNGPLTPDSPVNGDRPNSENPTATPLKGVSHTSSINTCNPVPLDPSQNSGCKCPVPPPPEIIFYGPQDRPPLETFLLGTQENDEILGDDRHEGIFGFAAHDFLWGKGGTDVLYGDTGADYMLGGVGSDFPVGPGIERDRIEGGKGNDFINGNEGNDTLYGGRANDIIHGGKDDDLIFANLDNDILSGDLGNDTILGGNGRETPIGTAGDRDLIFGNRGNDLLNGNEGEDIIYSGKNDDIAYGGKDNDLVYGDLGNDILLGDQGDDSLFGGPSDPNVPDLGGRDLIYGGESNDFINGNQGDDTLHGGNSNDIIHGGKDNDILCGSAGDDLLFGDLGDDTLYGEDGSDTIRGGIGNDAPLGSVGDRDFLCAGLGDDWLEGNAGKDTLIGGSGNDTLYGGKDDDLLYGSAGDDFLSGDLGNDTLTGGAGRDRFVLRAGFGTDTITDFTPGEDEFVLGEGLTFNLLNFVSSNCGTAIALGDEILAIVKGIEPEAMVAETFSLLT
ncbi:DUF4347 domain-containing protein [Laspinema olomoucense]|uniref:DUF4347 domain-containing protein n=1 Tax=Laspinema olomoucense TaxID=3231600 RepID=UPI0021BB6218|nr:DUF4347 domain-containing protein [Laspinema sp. D3c]MCT7996856.1 DUF4347 domain-containing protein [Laspinema sp. D3c]